MKKNTLMGDGGVINDGEGPGVRFKCLLVQNPLLLILGPDNRCTLISFLAWPSFGALPTCMLCFSCSNILFFAIPLSSALSQRRRSWFCVCDVRDLKKASLYGRVKGLEIWGALKQRGLEENCCWIILCPTLMCQTAERKKKKRRLKGRIEG